MLATSAGIRAFSEKYVTSRQLANPTLIDDFASFDGRRVRYETNWALYENTIYRALNTWAAAYKSNYALYRYVRSIYSPAYRLAEFHRSHIWGGALDPDAGAEKGCFPIVTENESLRQYIAKVWKWSNWQTRKDVVTLRGSVFGDGFIQVVDDVKGQKVRFDLIHPGLVESVEKDAYGNVKSYVLVEQRFHPMNPTMQVEWREECVKGENGQVVFRTYLNGAPFAWGDQPEEWEEPYGFVPMIHIQHNDVGLQWGWSEFHPARAKMHELDDLASMLGDQLRKAVNTGWVIGGSAASATAKTPVATPTVEDPEPGRRQIPMFFGTSDVKAIPLVAPIDIPGICEHIKNIQEDLERDYPELKFDILRTSGDATGRALRIARQPAENKMLQRRAVYDDALVRAQQMALSIGGYRGYFPGINLDSYAAGKLDHSIGDRPVFGADRPGDDPEFWSAANQAKAAGLLTQFLKRDGWSEEEIAEVEAKAEEAQAAAIDNTPSGDEAQFQNAPNQ